MTSTLHMPNHYTLYAMLYVIYSSSDYCTLYAVLYMTYLLALHSPKQIKEGLQDHIQAAECFLKPTEIQQQLMHFTPECL